jgi:DNA-binding NtrC family response regulator
VFVNNRAYSPKSKFCSQVNHTMPSRVLVFTPSTQLSATILEQANGVANWEVTFAFGIDEAKTQLLTQSSAVLLLDCCNHRLQSELSEFLNWFADHVNYSIHLVVLTNGQYPLSLVSQIDKLNATELSLPLMFEDLGKALTNHHAGLVERPPRIAETRELTADGITFATRTPEMFGMVERLGQIARHDVTLLLVGETGTGKTTLARIIHGLSERAGKKFLTTACGALPQELIESELFGHLRGAFTSADQNKIGRFEAAEGGTLLLDEIDVLSPREQTRLLRVIETGEYEPVGSTVTRKSNVRLIVASNVDLTKLSESKQFRSDLYYRLNVLEFQLLPLRDRRPDIVPLSMKFVAESCKEHGKTITHVASSFLKLLRQYDWPGNLRELSNQIRRAVLLSKNGLLSVDALSDAFLDAARNQKPRSGSGVELNGQSNGHLSHQLSKSEREILVEALRANNNNRSATARALGISRVGFYKRMRRVGLMPPLEK